VDQFSINIVDQFSLDKNTELDVMLNMDETPETEQGHDRESEHDDEREAAKNMPYIPSRMTESQESLSAKEKPSLLAALEKNAEKSKAMFGDAVENVKRKEVTV
jgi:hypothetical protein